MKANFTVKSPFENAVIRVVRRSDNTQWCEESIFENYLPSGFYDVTIHAPCQPRAHRELFHDEHRGTELEFRQDEDTSIDCPPNSGPSLLAISNPMACAGDHVLDFREHDSSPRSTLEITLASSRPTKEPSSLSFYLFTENDFCNFLKALSKSPDLGKVDAFTLANFIDLKREQPIETFQIKLRAGFYYLLRHQNGSMKLHTAYCPEGWKCRLFLDLSLVDPMADATLIFEKNSNKSPSYEQELYLRKLTEFAIESLSQRILLMPASWLKDLLKNPSVSPVAFLAMLYYYLLLGSGQITSESLRQQFLRGLNILRAKGFRSPDVSICHCYLLCKSARPVNPPVFSFGMSLRDIASWDGLRYRSDASIQGCFGNSRMSVWTRTELQDLQQKLQRISEIVVSRLRLRFSGMIGRSPEDPQNPAGLAELLRLIFPHPNYQGSSQATIFLEILWSAAAECTAPFILVLAVVSLADFNPQKFLPMKGTRNGRVVSHSGKKSLIVERQRRSFHARYGKVIVSTKRYHVHDEHEQARLDDLVKILPCRPLSATKRWELLSIIERPLPSLFGKSRYKRKRIDPTPREI